MERYSSGQRWTTKRWFGFQLLSRQRRSPVFTVSKFASQWACYDSSATENVAVAPQSNNELTAYESQLKVLEKKLAPGSMAPPTIGHSNSNARSNTLPPQANFGLKLQNVRIGATNSRPNGQDAKFGSSTRSPHISSSSRMRAKQRNNSAIEHLPVLPEWYRTTQAMTVLNLSRAEVSAVKRPGQHLIQIFER